MSGFEAAINEMLAELGRQRESLTRLQQGMTSVTGTAVSPRRQVSVVVDAQGEILELKFLNQSYRSMPGTELASLIVATIREAQRDARARMVEEVGSIGVAGADVSDFAEGNVDWATAFTDALSVPQPFLDLLQRPPTDLLDDVDLDAELSEHKGEGDVPVQRQEPGADK